jgi:murein DD-endopeptidase MepM/ murein hydrolase activator NlpD
MRWIAKRAGYRESKLARCETLLIERRGAKRYAELMSGSHVLRLALYLVAGTSAAAQSPITHSTNIVLTPAVVEAGAPELIRVRAGSANAIEGEWLGRKIKFFRSHAGSEWIALAGVDVEAHVGPSALRVTAHLEGKDEDLSETIVIHPAHYRTGSLTVSPKFVEPSPEALAEIKDEEKIKTKVFAASVGETLWRGSFHAPVAAGPTDSFGTRRMFNGKLASIHKGADFRAAMGTPVHASNSGVVVLARPLYYEGNCVIIDHGMGLYTLSMHFSRIDVHEGQRVKAGDRLGLSGATGRVTGPHLHWAVRWQGAYLDPVKLLRMNLNTIH